MQRIIGPVWSRPNAFGHGVPFRCPASPDTGPGLTDLVKALIRACSELKILIDLSHLNEQGFWDVRGAILPAPSPDPPTRAGFKFMWGLRGSSR